MGMLAFGIEGIGGSTTFGTDGTAGIGGSATLGTDGTAGMGGSATWGTATAGTTAGMGGSVTGGTVAAGICGTVGSKVGTVGKPGTVAAGAAAAAVVSARWRAAWHELLARSAHAMTTAKKRAAEAIARNCSQQLGSVAYCTPLLQGSVLAVSRRTGVNAWRFYTPGEGAIRLVGGRTAWQPRFFRRGW
jgi:hypothetical protein